LRLKARPSRQNLFGDDPPWRFRSNRLDSARKLARCYHDVRHQEVEHMAQMAEINIVIHLGRWMAMNDRNDPSQLHAEMGLQQTRADGHNQQRPASRLHTLNDLRKD